MTYRDLHRILLANGFEPTQGKGSHLNYRKPGHPRLVTVRNGPSARTVPANALSNYKKSTGIDFETIRRVKDAA